MEDHINYYRIERSIRYLEENFTRQPTLDEVAEQAHISPFHFQRIFTAWAGISPKRFLQFLTIDFLKEKLAEVKNVAEAAHVAGLSGQSRVYDLFVTLEGVTPQQYKALGHNLVIQYGFHDTPFGTALLGITSRGICWMAFLAEEETPQQALIKMQQYWAHAHLEKAPAATLPFMQRIFHPGAYQPDKNLLLYVKGTNFQLKVWEALLRIPAGNLTTYQHIAKAIDNPRALQAVGSAVGANPIAYLIPCHRVIRKDGLPGEYRWNAARKKGIIGWEMARHA